ncbi:hypothetical protein R1flu_010523 [Riccia fluitans]|uniref:Uncharacterized protein n=1 Tax=Riccia fluitans TaxID=41844 RepID=A0ABD1Z573_9MARC
MMHRGGIQFLALFILLHQVRTFTLVYGNGIPSSCVKLEAKYKQSLGLDGTDTVEIPEDLQVPAGNKLRFCYFAEGVQEYKFNGTAWNNFNASAILLGRENQIMGQHFYLPEADNLGGQPTWETFSPWSMVTSKPLKKILVMKDATAWVLLQSTHESGSRKRFGRVTYTQRLFTSGSLSPNSSSSEGAVYGQYVESPYTAVYAYYTKHH